MRDLNRRRRVEQIAEAALALFLERGVSDVTVDDIVARAGIAKGSFYRYFQDLEDLVGALLRPLGDRFRAALDIAADAIANATPADIATPYLTLAATLSEAVNPHRDLLRLYLQESRGPAVGARRPIRLLADEITTRTLELAVAGRRRGWFRDSDPKISSLMIIGAAERLLFEHLGERPLGDPTAISGALVSMILEGLRKR